MQHPPSKKHRSWLNKIYIVSRGRQENNTVKTGIIENLARMLELPLLVRSVSQVRAEGESPRSVLSPHPKLEILEVLASFSIISVLTVTLSYP